jgi:hypothetical protein
MTQGRDGWPAKGGRPPKNTRTCGEGAERESVRVRTQFLSEWRQIFRVHANDASRSVAGRATDEGTGGGVSEFFKTT